jgi:NTE family protein
VSEDLPEGADSAAAASVAPREATNVVPFQWPTGSGRKRINLALQGGGAHGAFTWGVLDRILGDGRLQIAAVSGTSAGAMNGAVLAAGLSRGGPEGARAALKTFWKSVSRDAAMSPIQRTALDVMLSSWSLDHNPALTALDVMSRVFSPYQFNPLNWNPLRDLLAQSVNFDDVRACDCIDLFVTATNVHTGRARVFSGREVTVDAVMASACLPFLFQAVEIEGVPYWDGGYMGNPVLSPFFKAEEAADILVVQVNPISRENTPETAREIQDRVNEISFNAPLVRELRHAEFINERLRAGDLKGTGYREVFLHRVGGGDELQSFTASTKLNAEWAFLKHLRDIGREAATQWLERHCDDVGVRSTINARAMGQCETRDGQTATTPA